MKKRNYPANRRRGQRQYPVIPIEEKFDRRIQMDGVTTCWYWAGNTNRTYGIIQHQDRAILAHRFSYERFKGPIPTGLDIDHICRNKLCVNPAHLRAVTRQENMLAVPEYIRRNPARRKSHCKHGHAFTPENTGWTNASKTERYCRTCRRTYQNERRAL